LWQVALPKSFFRRATMIEILALTVQVFEQYFCDECLMVNSVPHLWHDAGFPMMVWSFRFLAHRSRSRARISSPRSWYLIRFCAE